MPNGEKKNNCGFIISLYNCNICSSQIAFKYTISICKLVFYSCMFVFISQFTCVLLLLLLLFWLLFFRLFHIDICSLRSLLNAHCTQTKNIECVCVRVDGPTEHALAMHRVRVICECVCIWLCVSINLINCCIHFVK